jgi:hypothetical protein
MTHDEIAAWAAAFIEAEKDPGPLNTGVENRLTLHRHNVASDLGSLSAGFIPT